MGLRGPGAYRYWTNPCSSDFRELVFGPVDESPNHIRLLRNRWHDGGENAVHQHYLGGGSARLGVVAVFLPAARTAHGSQVSDCRHGAPLQLSSTSRNDSRCRRGRTRVRGFRNWRGVFSVRRWSWA